MIDETDTCGLFGKLPMQSDFVSHFLPESYTQFWHGWLQASLSVSQEQLGEQWLANYLGAPIWRFAIMPCIVHELGVNGVLIPSVDEVGRYFPLTIAHLSNGCPWNAFLSGQSWYEKVEYTALLALEDNISYATFMNYFERLRPPELAPWKNLIHAETTNGRANVVMQGLESPGAGQDMGYLVHSLYCRLFGSYSLWWTEGTEAIDPCTLASAGIPESGQFAALLDGKWQEWGWNPALLMPQE